ncbi:MAG TPA: NTP transferase domain-containing protein [Methanoregula sp.]|nr:NTP transferase domain-containing protein [Methanoregula sp.]
MYALIMAGGSGSRLSMGEKPLISICGVPMIFYVIDAFSAAGLDPVVVASPKTPMTMNWCRAHSITFIKSEGIGFVEDMISAVQTLDEHCPLFVCVSDIPCITREIIQSVADAYHKAGKDACSTWIPSCLVSSCRGGMPYIQRIDGIEACPAGVNILRGDLITQPQEELQILLNDPGLALNVNTRADRAKAEGFIKKSNSQKRTQNS